MERPTYDDPDVYRDLAGFEGEWRDTWWNADFLALLAERFALNTYQSVLDVGCGAGHWGQGLLQYMAPQARLHGIDHEESFVQMATERAQPLTAECTYQVGQAERLPFEDDSFDLVTCQTVLIHVPDAAAVVAEMLRVTRPGGRVLLVEPDNVSTATAFYNTTVPMPLEDTLAIVRMQLTAEAGKRALGEGDGSIGAHLPMLLHGAGAKAVQVYGSDKCASQVPPYDDRLQAIDLREQLRFAGMDYWLQTGAHDDTRRHFLAGGGDEATFEACWAVALRWLRAFEQQVREGTFCAARPVTMVVAAGQPK